MKICWFKDDPAGGHRLGLVRGDVVLDVSAALKALPAPSYPPLLGDSLIAHLPAVRIEIERLAATASALPLSGLTLLSPVASPSKIIGVPVNYAEHVAEAAADTKTFTGRFRGSIEEQGFFLKANSALVGCSEGVALRFPDRRTDHEMELGVVIGRRVSDVPVDQALDCIAGYAIALDMVVRGGEDRSLRKSVDSYAVLGPWLVTADEIPTPGALDFSLSVNGELRQQANTADMIMGIAEQIAYASRFYTLLPGDIIMTGTPQGVGEVRPGDRIDCAIDGVGAMHVNVRAAAPGWPPAEPSA